jgi:DNA-binding NarL/FixJ family response regulator
MTGPRRHCGRPVTCGCSRDEGSGWAVETYPFEPSRRSQSAHRWTATIIVVEAFRAGASAYILKNEVEDLNHALNAVSRGHVYLSPSLPTDIITVLAEAVRKPLASEDRHKIPRRQREVLQLIAEGKKMKGVAAILGISPRSAEAYKYDLMHSLGIRSSSELVQYAVRAGVITIQPLRIAA